MKHDDTLNLIERIKASHPGNIGIASFSRDYFASLSPHSQSRLLTCLKSGMELPESEMGVYANLAEDYDDLRPFFTKVLSEFHGTGPDDNHKGRWSLPAAAKVDLGQHGLPPLSLRIRVGRNLAGFPLTPAMKLSDRLRLETLMCETFTKLEQSGDLDGQYHSLTEGHEAQITAEDYQSLIDRHLIFKDMGRDAYLKSSGISGGWPRGRGCYVSRTEEFIIWVGEEDHLRIMVMRHSTRPDELLQDLKRFLDGLEKAGTLSFAHNSDLGYVTACPTNLGTAMRASAHLALPNLLANEGLAELKQTARNLGLSLRGLGGEHTDVGKDGTVDVSPRARFCITEGEIVARLCDGLIALHQLEAAAVASKRS